MRVAELLVPKIAEAGPPKRIAAGLGDGVDDRAVDPPVLGVIPVGQDLDFLDVLLAVALIRAATALTRDVDAVHLTPRHFGPRPAHRARARIAPRASDP